MKYGGLGLADPKVVARHALIGNFTASVKDLKNYAGLTGLGAPVASAPLAEGTSERAARAAVRRLGAAAAGWVTARATADEGPCWGAWEATWNAVRDDLQRDLHAAKADLDQALRDRETAHTAPARNVSLCRTTDFIFKLATKLCDNLQGALQLFPCGAAEVATSGAKWKERGVQKALSKVAHARIFNTLHKQYLDDENYTAAATLLSTAAPGAMALVTFNDHSFKTDTLSNDNFRTAMRFTLGLDQTNLAEAARENTPCGNCDTAFPTAEHYQVHALTIKAGSAGGSTYNTHNHILEAVANCAGAVSVAYSVGSIFHGVRNKDANCRVGTYTDPSGARHVKYANIAFLNMPQSAFNAQRVYGDVTHRSVVRLADGDPAPMGRAHIRAGARRSRSPTPRKRGCATRRFAAGRTRRSRSSESRRAGACTSTPPPHRHLREVQGGR